MQYLHKALGRHDKFCNVSKMIYLCMRQGMINVTVNKRILIRLSKIFLTHTWNTTIYLYFKWATALGRHDKRFIRLSKICATYSWNHNNLCLCLCLSLYYTFFDWFGQADWTIKDWQSRSYLTKDCGWSVI